MIRETLDAISLWAIPVLLVGIPLVGMIREVKVYDVFIEGAKEGFDVAIRIIPFLVGILVAIGMFRASGAMDLLTDALRPLMAATGFPAELFPLAILRTAHRQRLARASRPTSSNLRPRLAHRTHGRHDVRQLGDDLLRAGRLLRRHRRNARATPSRPRSSATSSPRSRPWPSACGCSDATDGTEIHMCIGIQREAIGRDSRCGDTPMVWAGLRGFRALPI